MALGGERRHAAILFVDIAGYTELCAQVDTETVHGLIGAFFAQADAIVAELGGYVVDHAGDALVACFGAPRAHDDDSVRAAHAALKIHAAAARLHDPRGGALRLHAGIASGDVVASTIESAAGAKYTVTGEAVNLAARICAEAQPGSTLVSDACRRLLGDRFSLSSAGKRLLKGFPVPQALFRVERATEVALQAPFVGRRQELAHAVAQLERSERLRHPLAVAIRGDPGLGKSALLGRVLAEAASRGHRVLSAGFLDFPLPDAIHPFAALLGAGLGLGSACEEAQLRSRLDGNAELYPAAAELLGIAAAGSPGMEYASRLAARGAVLGLSLAHAAAAGPLTVSIEDLHWADADALAVLHAAMRSLQGRPVAFVWTARPLGEAESLLSGVSEALPTAVIDLRPLSMSESRALAMQANGVDSLFAERCVKRAEGNPLYLVHLLQAGSAPADGMPGNLRNVVLARVDRLPPEEQAALHAASVLGTAFRMEQVDALLQREHVTLESSLRAGLVRRAQAHWEFSHALVHEAIYGSLLRSRRRVLHEAAAALLLPEGHDAAGRAQHLDRADRPEAAGAYLQAGREEWAHRRGEQTLKLVRRGLELEPGTPVREALLTLMAQVLLDIGRTREAIAAFQQALEGEPSAEERCRALVGLADAYRTAGEHACSFEALALAQPLAERHGRHGELSRLHGIRGNVHFARFEIESCEAEHRASLRWAKVAGERDAVVRALTGQGDAAYARGRLRAAAACFDEAQALARAYGLPREEISASAMQALCTLYLGPLEASLAQAADALVAAQRLRSVPAEVMVQSIRATILYSAGRYEESQAMLDEALAKARAAQVRRFEAVLLRWSGNNACALGDRTLARQRLEAALRLAREGSLRFLGASILGSLALAAEDAAQRDRAVAEGLELLELGSASHCHLNFYRDTIDAFLDCGEPRRALAMADRLAAYGEDAAVPWRELYVARGRALARVLLAPEDKERRGEARAAVGALHAAGLRAPLASLEGRWLNR